MGNVLWIFCLCSKPQDTTKELCSFFNAILDRGYQYTSIQPIFEQAIDNATSYLTHTNEYREQLKQKKCRISHCCIFLHLPYHPNNPSSHTIQHLWHQTVFQPPCTLPVNHLTNSDVEPIPINQTVIAYSWAPNIGNLLSYCKICQRSGPKVSSFLWLDISKPFLFWKLWQAMPSAGLLKAFKIKLFHFCKQREYFSAHTGLKTTQCMFQGSVPVTHHLNTLYRKVSYCHKHKGDTWTTMVE